MRARWPRSIIALVIIAGLVRASELLGIGLLISNIDRISAELSALSAPETSTLPADDPTVVLPKQQRADVAATLTGAGYDCLIESSRRLAITGCYRYDDDLWVDLRFRTVHGAIVGISLDGGSYDNGDSVEFRRQVKIIASTAMDAATVHQVLGGVDRAAARNGPVTVDTTSARGWSGTVSTNADQYGNEFSLRLNSTGDRDGRFLAPRILPLSADAAAGILDDLGYDCADAGAERDCDDVDATVLGDEGTITIIGQQDGIGRIEADFDDLQVLADFLAVVRRADPADARLLTAAVLRTNDGRSHHLVINNLMVAAEPGWVGIYGIDWPL
ncbi:hypothetical protein FOE78_21490 [Microlunatus elymi]|uniref:Uncharacterized protein n=1 Tax=Microlunatus elymi TaxID=2596828 RepID=A0A516Q3X4_9ACTN|nr:hypothetical protein [Microlunatus elymi]QDP98130.1 hypothetical protein FOE78_21490 [Microlunatus elymi]